MVAEIGRTFGRVAADYERTRPEYPDEAVDWIVASLDLGVDATVLDLGAGTGKLTRKLGARLGTVVAVEPDDAMRAVHGNALAGRAESIPLPEASVDAVFAGDSFHWFDPEPAMREIVRVLRPGGGIGILWNGWFGREDPPLPQALRDELAEVFHRSGPARRSNHDWRSVLAASGFAEPEERAFRSTAELSGRDVVDLNLTASSLALLPDEDRAALAERASGLVAARYRLETVTTAISARLA